MMKAIIIDEFGGPEKLHVAEMPKPTPLDREVLIRVAYAGVNPVDWKIREGYLQNRIPHDFPIILGWDVAGHIVEKGKDVHNLKVGDEVFAYVRKPLIKWGSYAEYVAFDSRDVILKPRNLSLAQAAALPLVSLTAWQSLFDAIHLQKGETILIQGGSGGVGSMGIQFAKWKGAKVVTTARKEKHSYVKELGADVALDHHDDVLARLHEYAPGGVDVVFDCVGGEVFWQSLSCLRKGGRIVSILEQMDLSQEKSLGIQAKYVFVSPSGNNLQSIRELIEQQKVIAPRIEEMRIEDAGIAQEKLKSGKVWGKIVLRVFSE